MKNSGNRLLVFVVVAGLVLLGGTICGFMVFGKGAVFLVLGIVAIGTIRGVGRWWTYRRGR